MGIEESDVIVFGRSMGSGVACSIAGNENYSPLALCLMSPYKSIREVAASKAGFLANLVKERFSNIQAVQESIRCPSFILHGERDNVVPFEHGLGLFNALQERYQRENKLNKIMFVRRANMTHNDFDIDEDLLDPLQDFLNYQQINTQVTESTPAPVFRSIEIGNVPNRQ